MMTLTTKSTLLGALVFSVSSMAPAVTVVTLSALDLNTGFGSNPGTPGAVSAPVGTPSATHSFTVSGLDVAEDGTANDTVTFSYLVQATNGNISGIGNPFSYGVDGAGDPPDNEIDPDEGLSFSTLNATAVFGDSNVVVLSIDDANFTRFDSRFPGGGDIVNVTEGITGMGAPIAVNQTPDGGGNDPYNFTTPQPSFTVLSGGGNGFGIDTIGATFTLSVVPEPSSAVLLSMAAFGFISRRRR